MQYQSQLNFNVLGEPGRQVVGVSCEIHGLGIGVNKYSSTQVNLAATVLRMVWCVVLWVALFYYLSTIYEPTKQLCHSTESFSAFRWVLLLPLHSSLVYRAARLPAALRLMGVLPSLQVVGMNKIILLVPYRRRLWAGCCFTIHMPIFPSRA